MNIYSDIIILPHPQSRRHRQMPVSERAAQFAPFAALTGFGEQICEQARLTDRRPVLSDEDAFDLNEKLMIISQSKKRLRVSLSYFVPDRTKRGGALFERQGEVRLVDFVSGIMIFSDRSVISLNDIFALAIL